MLTLSLEAQTDRPIFRESVDLVSVGVVVRDDEGRIVRNLPRDVFAVLDGGRERRIVQFGEDDSRAISLAILFDVSGSMEGTPLGEARRAADHVLSWLQPDVDEAALFSFDTSLREVQGFTRDTEQLHDALDRLEPFGATSLYDALAACARQLENRPTKRRGIVAVTDGVDTSSRLKPSAVAAIASEIDVPVYVVAVVSPLDHPGIHAAAAGAVAERIEGDLQNLAAWTGGDVFVASAPAHASVAARRLLAELRHQYLLAFEPSPERGDGWRSLEVRVRDDRRLQVRARRGYSIG
jgi:Ca-activated chloride channel family protein